MLIPTLPASDSNIPARRPPTPGFRARVAPFLAALVLLAGASLLSPRPLSAAEPDSPPSPAPRVIATYYPLYLIAVNVMKGLRPAPSILLEPAGGCAHGMSLRPSQVATLGRADVVLETGLGMEPFLESERLPWRDDIVRVALAGDIPETDLIPLLGEHDHEHQAPEHDHENEPHAGEMAETPSAAHGQGAREGFNGHAWASPRLAARMTRTLGDALARHDPANAELYRLNASRHADELDRLAAEVRALAARLRGARVALSHTSLAYLARDLGLEVTVVLRDEDENEPGPRTLARLIREAREGGLDAVLYDPQDDGRLARLFAEETDAPRRLELNPLAAGPLRPSAYSRLMKTNLETLKTWAREIEPTRPTAQSAAALPNHRTRLVAAQTAARKEAQR